ncbi:MurR/RpiR family transcriptional regulator [Alkalicoccus luteus]|uniref:MurR/RpiR family transcriptional regulator n=1 Tax=Alkalicoccus luteus TaxID=1237094 RepID=A0A969PXN9_9BACI|nr:MurR/RpiR family transcriptional regulator [Alkalicoccus luteus]NJP37502.1 MurR/RpiR family transcriptional regulator [Alkalicoccus luteus]
MEVDELSLKDLLHERYNSFSRGQKKVAGFFLTHASEAAMLTAGQIGERTDVSETTVIRFSHALGYRGFSELQEAWRTEWLGVQEHGPVYAGESIPGKEIRMLEGIDTEALEPLLAKWSRSLLQAERVVIAGFDGTYAAAYWLAFSLRGLRKRIHLVGPETIQPEDTLDLDEGTCVILLSFPRYHHQSKAVAEAAGERAGELLVLTDHASSPPAVAADSVWTASVADGGDYRSAAYTITLLEMLLEKVEHDADELGQAAPRRKELEKLYAASRRYLE